MLFIGIYLDYQVFYVVGLGVMHYLYELQHSSSLSRKYSEAVWSFLQFLGLIFLFLYWINKYVVRMYSKAPFWRCIYHNEVWWTWGAISQTVSEMQVTEHASSHTWLSLRSCTSPTLIASLLPTFSTSHYGEYSVRMGLLSTFLLYTDFVNTKIKI